jgi:hypothetical protein
LTPDAGRKSLWDNRRSGDLQVAILLVMKVAG